MFRPALLPTLPLNLPLNLVGSHATIAQTFLCTWTCM